MQKMDEVECAPILMGKNIFLRPLTESDIGERYLSWLNDQEVTRYMSTGQSSATITKSDLYNYFERFKNSKTDFIFGIVDCATKQHIGNVTLNHLHPVNKTADTGIMIGVKDFWGKGYAFEAWSLLIEHAFLQLKVRRIEACTLAENKGSLQALKKLGFKMEGIRRRHFLVEGRECDEIHFGLFHSEFYKFRP